MGEVQQVDAFVALVAEEAWEEGSEQREVRGYLSDGKQLAESFVGMASGDEVQLTSENGAQLDTTLASDGAFGKIALPHGQRFEFEAGMPTRVEGFYTVEIPSGDGPLSATSWRSAQLEGVKTGAEIAGSIASPNGEMVAFEVPTPTIEEGENHWIILMGEGQQIRIKGAMKNAQSSGFVSTQSSPLG